MTTTRPDDLAFYSGDMLLAYIWHFWLGVGLVIGAVLTTIALFVGYLSKVTAPQYPKRNQDQ